MQRVKPSIFISIPKKWTQIYDYISAHVDLELAEKTEIKKTAHEITGGNLKWGLSAAGFLPPEVFIFFQQNGVELMSGFGMTEATGGITMTPPGRYVHNSLGKPLPGIKVKLDKDGEMLIKGDYVMKGYFAVPDEETFNDEGFFPTGDVMKQDERGFYEIIDRKKEIYKNIRGETIAPQKIENLFRDFEYVKQVFLVGDHRPFNTALIYPNYETEDKMFSGFDLEKQQEYFSSVIVTVNKFLAAYERIVDFRLVTRPFSADTGELTPKGTYKRREIEKNFDDTIEDMYSKNHTEVYVGGIEVRIPNWFLREKGTLSRDIIPQPDAVNIPKLGVSLRIKKCSGENHFIIGDFCYHVKERYIDLQQFIINPVYWCGNHSLFEFTGSGIIQWYRQTGKTDKLEFLYSTGENKTRPRIREQVKRLLAGGEVSLEGLHYAAVLLQALQAEEALLGLHYISIALKNKNIQYYNVLFETLKRPVLNDTVTVRREMFKTAVKNLEETGLKELLIIYLNLNPNLPDQKVIRTIIEDLEYPGLIGEIEEVLDIFAGNLDGESAISETPVPWLFDLIAEYGINHPTSYEHLRQVFVRFQLRHDRKDIADEAERARTHMRYGFRSWLGANQTVAVDMETGEEYRWKDVITFDENVDEQDKQKMIEAISKTPVLREAIFLFSGGKLILLNNILPGGIWISLHRTFEKKAVYRISVQTRLQGSFDILLNINREPKPWDVHSEVNWLILAGSRHFMQELVEDFGGYWQDYGIWTAKYSPGSSVSRYLTRETRRMDEQIKSKLKSLWHFFVWNASAAYFNLWKLTGYNLQLRDASTNNFIIPTHDYQTGTKIVSLSESEQFTDLSNLFSNFYSQFVEATENEYPFLKDQNIFNYVYAGLMNAEGEASGREILSRYAKELETKGEKDGRAYLTMRRFIETLDERRFIPKQLYFAIRRYHRWHDLNRDASLTAKAQTLSELYETYLLPQLEKSYPETRTRFFLDTAFKESSESLRSLLLDIIKKQIEKTVTLEEARIMFTNIKSEFELSDAEEFFITRLSYPHLKPDDYAALIRMRADGISSPNLVVQFDDYEGNPYYIRKPVSPKEISRLHQLFMEANLMVNFKPEHQFLVAVSERGFLIGGLFYLYKDDETVHMEKIVVSNRYRRKGISDRLMNELFNRLKGENFSYVTTGFFRPEYFYRFDFKIEKKYSGLVKEL